MKIIEQDIKKKIFKVIPEDYEDLWILEKIIHKGDIVEGKTKRTIDVSGKKESILCYIKLEVEKKELERKYIRFSGKILEGSPENLIPKGSYHSLKFSIGDEITFIKGEITNYELELLNTPKQPDFYIISLDEDECQIFELKNNEFKLLKTIVNKDALNFGQYFSEIIKFCENFENIVICGTGVAPEELSKIFPKKHLLIKTSMAGKIGAKEVLQSQKLLEEYKISQIIKLWEKVKELIGKYERVVFGEEIEKNIYLGELLLICEKYYLENTDKCYDLIKKIESVRGKVIIVPMSTEVHDELWGFGGIILVKRY